MRLETFRTLVALAALFDLDIRQFDVSAAYLHGEIDGEIYMEPPPRATKMEISSGAS
jgi:Reverse transcriptase (RNA-dependent DNA polymerase)